MWRASIDSIDHDRLLVHAIYSDSGQLNVAQVIAGWKNDIEFRQYFISLLQDAPFPAYFWECPVITKATLTHPFEFALVNAQQLKHVNAESHVFENYFDTFSAETGVATFMNLGNDAMLVSPHPPDPGCQYAHLAAFVRSANMTQQHALWIHIATALEQQLEKRAIWLSTSGLGVYWLHIRLDTVPKYYTYAPYKQSPH